MDIIKYAYNFKLLLFFVIFSLLKVPVISFKYFKAFNILSSDILIISDDGIIKYNIELDIKYLIVPLDMENPSTNIEFITVNQFSSYEGGYIICRINENIYILSEDALISYGSITVSDIYNQYIDLIPYITVNSKKAFIICYINNQMEIVSILHEINISRIEESKVISYKAQKIEYKEGKIVPIYSNGIGCKMVDIEREQNVLTCFINSNDNYMNVISMEQENNFNPIEINRNYINTITSLITVENGPNKINNLVCFADISIFKCIKYNSILKEWSNITIALNGCSFFQYNRGLKYINEEYLVYCYSSLFKVNYIKLDEEYNIKQFNENGKCTAKIENCLIMYASALIYNKNENNISLLTKCAFQGDKFRIININDECEVTVKDINTTLQTILTPSLTPQSSLISKSPISPNSLILNQQSSLISTSPKISTSIYLTHLSALISTTSPIKTILISSTIEKESTIFKYISELTSISIKTTLPLSNQLILTLINKSSLIESSIQSTSSINCIDNLNEIDFYDKGEIIKGKTNQSKEDINLDKVINSIEIGKKYEINGNDYNIRISPVNLIDTFNSSYVEFSICEQILRKQYNLTNDEIITILQIEIDKLNEKALTNQIEYEVFSSDKKKLNLSYCKDVKIKVNYKIKNPSIINKTMVSQYSDLGIDIFDNQHSFFNDICYSYSNTNSDIILKDRILDIYQNFSLCDNGCDYEEIDINSMTVICSCVVKDEINVEVSEPVFGTIIEDAFKNSNFGVLSCYNLVFSLDYKTKNIGFWISLSLITINIILIIVYSIYGIESIKIYVFQEMRKNNYIIKIDSSPPLKRNKRKQSTNFINQFRNHFRDIYISSSNNTLKENKTNNVTENIYVPITKKKKKKKLKIRTPVRTLSNKADNYYKYENKILSSNSSNRLRQNKKKIITYGLDGSIYINNKNIYSHKEEIEEIENNKKCPGYYNLIQINSKNEENNDPPESLYILDNYDYESAIKFEKRHFLRIFYICLLSSENILNTFFFKTPLEIQSLRLILFIFNFICDSALNALFYLNQKLSDKYHYQGDNLYLFTLVNNLTISLTSTIFSYVLVKALDHLNNSKNSIEDLFRKHEKIMRKDKTYKVCNNDIIKINEKLNRIYKILKIKIVLYIIIEFLLLLFFFYYITAFCEVYKKTQISWLTDCFVSFLISILVEIVMSFLVATFYTISINNRFKILYSIAMFFYGLG